MALKVLPKDVRSILSASAQINSYKTAVEELVYNALDAESTSIAIRIHIQENRIQVIDNGNGITKNDFEVLGQRYMTSKLTDLSTLKSMPKCYGYRGEFLANVIEISQNVKIISRYKEGDETWAMTFHEGKKKQLAKMTLRPSKGTTVEIKEFLYNLKIKRRGIHPVNELHNIKSFLEQLSLVHNNISLSLRDDSRNDIVFKIHKKRDIYQTLSTLFDIDKNVVQELQIVKNEYKVKAFVGKTDMEIGKHWIYLNGKFVHNGSKLHITINEYLKKYLLITDKKKSKSKNNDDENHLFKSNIPFYYVFITCPYMDYDISTTLEQFVVEFKNWKQIKIMLEKLIKFYIGDVNLQEKKPEQQLREIKNKDNEGTTRCQIKEIIDKILGDNSKKMGVSLLHNGVKGKRIKRKKSKKNKSVNKRDLFVKINTESQLHEDNSLQNTKLDSKDGQHFSIKEDNINNNVKNTTIHEDEHVSDTLNKNNIITHGTAPKICVTTSNFKNNVKSNHKIFRMSPAKIVYKLTKKHCKIKPNGIRKTKNYKQQLNVVNTHKKTDYVPIKSRVVAQKAKEFLKYPNIYLASKENNANNCVNSRIVLNKKKQHTHCMRYGEPLSPNLNKYTIDKYLMYKMKVNPFKTTYDLVQTILNSQQEKKNNPDDNRISIHFQDYPVINQINTSINSPCNPRLSLNETYCSQDQKSAYSSISRNLVSYTLTCENTYTASDTVGKECIIKDTYDYRSKPIESTQHSLRCQDILRENSVSCTQRNSSFDLTYMPTVSGLTYESHIYNHFNYNLFNDRLQFNKNRKKYNINATEKTRFITKQSRDNFVTRDNKYSYKDNYICRTRENVRPYVKQTKYYSKHIKQTVDESYTIEFTKSSEITSSTKENEHGDYHHVNDKTYSILNSYSPNYEPISGFGNTYTIPTYNHSSDFNKNTPIKSNELFLTNSIHNLNNVEKKSCDFVNATNNVCNQDNMDKSKTVLISQPQNSNNDEVDMDENIQPINLCETVFQENGSIEKEFDFSFNRNSRLDDSLYNNFGNINPNNENADKRTTQIIRHQNANEDVSYHFVNTVATNHIADIDHLKDNLQSTQVAHNVNNCIGVKNHIANYNKDNEHTAFDFNDANFNFKDRLRFLPKGMSQIFENCGSKTICDYNLDKDYFEDIIYNDFAKDVQMQTAIYEPVIRNVEDLTTKDIHKFKNKVHKEITSLVFDEKSLIDAEVLNQVDCKFIAVIMKEKFQESDALSEYLVLFDQHAVHERIRLENNLADYFSENKWTSVPIDNITLKMSEDEILFLHNYKDKLNQLGLLWTIMNTEEILVSSIPEAVLGKNPREVEKVMKAVKNLIVEEINVIKLQKGCISLYPKSIMDLVFSEACRYAIKFGDKLSKNDCIDLINDLSNCKTPFQCAHGRPVMAVLVDIKKDDREYKVDMANIRQFKLKRKIETKN